MCRSVFHTGKLKGLEDHHLKMSDNNTQYFDTHQGGAALSIGASNSITSKRPKSKRRSVQLNDNGKKNPEQNEVLKNMPKKEGIRKARQAPPPSAKKTAERAKKKDTPNEASTSTRKRRKTSSTKKQGGASSTGVANNIAPQSEATALNKSKTKGKPKPKRKSESYIMDATFTQNKKVANANNKQGEVTPTYHPRQFIGLYVYKEHNGVKALGTVASYDYKTKLFKIGYDDDSAEYMEQNEVLRNMANAKDISEAQRAILPSNSSKSVDMKEQEAALGEGSTATRQKESDGAGEGPGEDHIETQSNDYVLLCICHYASLVFGEGFALKGGDHKKIKNDELKFLLKTKSNRCIVQAKHNLI
ncbi:hypothetical protein VNO77_16492 [Canavalia gladiata]|uniref:Uncharacterized protein n=1 Tax=Canavalia gladiata TaxID=3824 RepID=A0AAN9M474_CANGL